MMQTLRWLRGPGDLVFAAGVVALVWFAVGLRTGVVDRPACRRRRRLRGG
jgi:nitric oxide reductase subunit B